MSETIRSNLDKVLYFCEDIHITGSKLAIYYLTWMRNVAGKISAYCSSYMGRAVSQIPGKPMEAPSALPEALLILLYTQQA